MHRNLTERRLCYSIEQRLRYSTEQKLRYSTEQRLRYFLCLLITLAAVFCSGSLEAIAKDNNKISAWAAEFEAAGKAADKDDFVEAQIHYEKALSSLGPKDLEAQALTEQGLAISKYYQDRYSEAAELFEKSNLFFETEAKRPSRELSLGWEMLSRTYRHLDRLADSEKYAVKVLPLVAELDGKNSRAYALALRNLGKLRLTNKQYAEAETVLTECVKTLQSLEKTDDETLGICIAFLIYSLQKQNKTDEANAYEAQLTKLEKSVGRSLR